MKTCLVVDDSSVIRKVARRILEDLDFDVSEAEDGQQALDFCRQFMPDLIMVDWNMPKMDGITLVKKYRESNKTTPMIMATTEAEKTRVLEALKAGVNNYVIKPFTPEILVEKVKQTLDKLKAAA